MPQVPTYGDLKVRPDPIRVGQVSESAPIEAFGGGQAAAAAGQAAGNLARVGAQISEEALDEAAQMSFYENDAKLSAEESRIGLALEQVQGRDALPAADKALADYDAYHSELTRGVSSQRAKQALQRSYLARRTSLNARAQRYAAGQVREYDDAVTKSYIQNEQDGALGNFMDADRVKLGVDRQKAALIDYARRSGKPDEWLKLEIRNATSGTYRGVVERMLTIGDDRGAQKTFDAVKDQMSADDVVRLEGVLKQEALRGESQRWADAILDGKKSPHPSEVPTPAVGAEAVLPPLAAGPEPTEQPKMTREEQFEAASAIEDPKLRDMVTQRLRFEHAREDQLSEDRLNASFQDSWNKVMQSGGDLDSIDPSTLYNLPPGKQQALQTLSRRLTKKIPQETNPKVWAAFFALPQEKIAKLSESSMLELSTKLSDKHRDVAFKMWHAAREAKESPQKQAKFDDFISDREDIKRTAKRYGIGNIGIDDSDADIQNEKEKAEALMNLEDEVRARYNAHLASTGKNPTYEEKQKILSGIVRERSQTVTVKGWFSNSTEKISQLTPAEIETSNFQIPPATLGKLQDIAFSSSAVRSQFPNLSREAVYEKMKGRINRAFVEMLKLQAQGATDSAATTRRIRSIIEGAQ